jgi:hypothetical protein
MPAGFLRSWIATHVRDVADSNLDDQVSKWAASCVADALIAGIPYDDLLGAAEGNIVDYIKKAVDLAAGPKQA